MPETNELRRNSALEAALALVLLGALSNFLYFLNFPGQAIFPWLNLLLPALGVAVVLVGLKRAFGRPPVFRGKISGSIYTAIALSLFAISAWGFLHARAVPASAGAPQTGQKAPDFTLQDTSGQAVSLAQLLSAPMGAASGKASKAVLLVFYRGYW